MNFKWNESENFLIISKNYKELNEEIINILNFSKEYVKILNHFKDQALNLYSYYLSDYSKNKKNFCSNLFENFSKLIYAQINSFKTLIEGISIKNDNTEKSIKEKEIINKKINEQINNLVKDIEIHYSKMKKSKESFEKIGNETEDIIIKYYKKKKKERKKF